jgi:SAM-dependent methyltransferase
MDSVICLNVVEHVEDDATALRNIFNCLRPQGRAIILVPEGPSIYGTLDRVLGHYRRYTEEELKAKMEDAGFQVERILQFNRITRPGWYWNGRILRRRTFSRLQLWFFDRFVWLWQRIDPKLPWSPVSIIAVGVRP